MSDRRIFSRRRTATIGKSPFPQDLSRTIWGPTREFNHLEKIKGSMTNSVSLFGEKTNTPAKKRPCQVPKGVAVKNRARECDPKIRKGGR